VASTHIVEIASGSGTIRLQTLVDRCIVRFTGEIDAAMSTDSFARTRTPSRRRSCPFTWTAPR
jgi:hypothetical protein